VISRTAEGDRLTAALLLFNALPAQETEAALLRCCGAIRWARVLAAMRPFATADALFEIAGDLWWALTPDDWRQGFSAHPRIGATLGTSAESSDSWSAKEQAGAARADAGTRDALTRLNNEYETRFGHIFIVCATGLTGEQMLDRLRTRLQNDPDTEMLTAAEEHLRITKLRLGKVLTELTEAR
jgi:2-oxo-4-hydroxy-4-carboxy-5-ureidoimidazoline decarboxylase